jgi:hypothetical protein
VDADKKIVEEERDLLIRCIEDAYESLRILPGLDANGPSLVWFAENLRQAHYKSREASSA